MAYDIQYNTTVLLTGMFDFFFAMTLTSHCSKHYVLASQLKIFRLHAASVHVHLM